MSICRATATIALKKVKQYEKSISGIIANEPVNLRAAGHHIASQPQLQLYQQQQPPVSFGEGTGYSRSTLGPNFSSNTYNPMLRAEDTMRREQQKKKRAADCPTTFVQQFVTANGL